MVHILVAMEREAEALGIPCEIIGTGATDIPETAEDDIIVNVGYCGGKDIPVGLIVEPVESISGETGEVINLDHHFDCQPVTCVTSPEFVTEALLSTPAVYDMELAKLVSVPCARLYVLKIVSDNLDMKACESYKKPDAWAEVRRLLGEEGLI